MGLPVRLQERIARNLGTGLPDVGVDLFQPRLQGEEMSAAESTISSPGRLSRLMHFRRSHHASPDQRGNHRRWVAPVATVGGLAVVGALAYGLVDQHEKAQTSARIAHTRTLQGYSDALAIAHFPVASDNSSSNPNQFHVVSGGPTGYEVIANNPKTAASNIGSFILENPDHKAGPGVWLQYEGKKITVLNDENTLNNEYGTAAPVTCTEVIAIHDGAELAAFEAYKVHDTSMTCKDSIS